MRETLWKCGSTEESSEESQEANGAVPVSITILKEKSATEKNGSRVEANIAQAQAD